MSGFIDYYHILGLSSTASQQEIRKAYMQRALETHPDKNPCHNTKEQFQDLAEAYYILSDPQKRKEYDLEYHSPSNQNSHGFTRPSSDKGPKEKERAANNIFGDVFESLLRPEVEKESSVWRNVGTISGSALGFIIANIPGAIAGAFAGRSLGKIRDQKGKSVMEVFQELPYNDRLKILGAISAKILLTQVTH